MSCSNVVQKCSSFCDSCCNTMSEFNLTFNNPNRDISNNLEIIYTHEDIFKLIDILANLDDSQADKSLEILSNLNPDSFRIREVGPAIIEENMFKIKNLLAYNTSDGCVHFKKLIEIMYNRHCILHDNLPSDNSSSKSISTLKSDIVQSIAKSSIKERNNLSVIE